MKVFVVISALLALASANQSSHQTIQHGHAAPVHTSIHRPHGVHHASVVSQPAADPSDVHNPYTADYKPIAAVHAPAHAPVHRPAPYHTAPTTSPAPYHPAPVVHRPAPYHPAPVVHKPSPYHAAEIYGDSPAVYQYGYAVADDYAGTNFAANENRDGYSTNGEYRVALPDGRTQIVSYNVADAYSGYVADVRYEGEPHYDSYKPAHKPAPYHPAPYHA
nr:LOW QUALITY PROTEIN: splicing factor 3A subunit 2-like [Lepeophtheirus salmonis]